MKTKEIDVTDWSLGYGVNYAYRLYYVLKFIFINGTHVHVTKYYSLGGSCQKPEEKQG